MDGKTLAPPWLTIFVALAITIVVALVLRNTVFGRRIFALGSNEAAARACGIDTAHFHRLAVRAGLRPDGTR